MRQMIIAIDPIDKVLYVLNNTLKGGELFEARQLFIEVSSIWASVRFFNIYNSNRLCLQIPARSTGRCYIDCYNVDDIIDRFKAFNDNRIKFIPNIRRVILK